MSFEQKILQRSPDDNGGSNIELTQNFKYSNTLEELIKDQEDLLVKNVDKEKELQLDGNKYILKTERRKNGNQIMSNIFFNNEIIGWVSSGRYEGKEWISHVEFIKKYHGMGIYNKTLDSLEEMYDIIFIPGDLNAGSRKFWDKRLIKIKNLIKEGKYNKEITPNINGILERIKSTTSD